MLETGHCVVCGHEASFRLANRIITPQLKHAWGITNEMADAFEYRESQQCSVCGSSLRVRQLCAAIIQTFSELSGRAYESLAGLLEDDAFRRLRIAEINACGALHNYLKQHPNLYYSEYVPGVPCGSEHDGVRCEDLQSLTYPNDSFDIILTSDTVEHVPDPDKAWSEIRRTLKPGGYHIFTIPVVPSQPVTRQRAKLTEGRIEYLTEPTYHSGKWGAEDQLVYTDFAMDVVDLLDRLGLRTQVLYYEEGRRDVAFVFRSLKEQPPASTSTAPAKPEWTGERFLPWIEGAQIHYEHIHRYALASRFVKGKTVLDLGCGEGYGTYMLAGEAEYAVGVDIDEQTIRHAKIRYVQDNLQFIIGSCLDVPVQGEGRFDVVVCLEVIEHIAEHDKLLSEAARLLKDDGLFLVSTPNKAIYTDAGDYHNPFHIRELYFDEFKRLLQQHFAHIHVFGQRVYAGSNIWSLHRHRTQRYTEIVARKGEAEFDLAERTCKEPTYFIALASNAVLWSATAVTDSWLADASNTLLDNYETGLAKLDRIAETAGARISHLEKNLREKVAQIHGLESQIHGLESQIHGLESQMQQIERSIPMQLVRRYHRVIDRALRPGTRRRRAYNLVLSGIRVILNEGWRSFFRKAWRRFTHRPAVIRIPRPDLPTFNASISKKEADKLVFPMPSEEPAVSIIIPVHNKWRYTLNCLKSIVENTDGDYEALVIDDASTDETATILARVENLRLTINEQNEGFVESCNRGARASKGQYILFLNNDTMVTKGWLPPLLELMKRDDVGAVGSKLVFPDGTLQEAGSIVWRDGSALGYGRGDDPGKPEYNYVREVDYCSGACLMVKRELFEKAGGFDERFKPGYYEDTDLCFAVRELGYMVMYQPRSVVVHLEGVTCGTDVYAGIKRYQEINRPKFVAKWKTVLDKHDYYEIQKSVLSSRNRVTGRSILILDDRIPNPGHGSGFPRAYRLLRCVAELGYRVTFFPLENPTPWQPYTDELQQLGIEVYYGGNLDFSRFARNRDDCYDLVLVSRPHNLKKTFPLIKAFFPGAALLYDAEAIFSMREVLKARVNGDERMEKAAQGMMSEELSLVKTADLIITVCENEKRVIAEKTGASNVMVWGHPVEVREPETPFSQRKDILFVGGFPGEGSPNEDAIIYFAEEVFPKVETRLCCRLFIVGMNPPASVRKLSSSAVIVTGYVEDLRDYYEKCRLFIVPHKYSAGIPWKLHEAMSHGIPSVISKLTADQLGLTGGQEALVADTSEEFAEKIMELYQDQDLWQTVQHHALAFIHGTCAPENMKHALNEILLQGLQTRGGQ